MGPLTSDQAEKPWLYNVAPDMICSYTGLMMRSDMVNARFIALLAECPIQNALFMFTRPLIISLLLHCAAVTLAQSGQVITKSITIINGDTIVDEQVRSLDDASVFFFDDGAIDSLPKMGRFSLDIDIDSLFNEGFGSMNFEQFSMDSLLSQMEMRSTDIDGFFDKLDIDSLLGQTLGMVQEWDLPAYKGETSTKTLSSSNTVADRLEQALNRDGLLLPNATNEVQLSRKHLKINGDKQPANIHDKYLRMWQAHTGTTLAKRDRITLHLKGQARQRQLQKG